MRALLNGERHGSAVQVATFVALIAVSVAGLLLINGYRAAWRHAQRGEYELCVQRETYDNRMHTVEQADAALQRALIADYADIGGLVPTAAKVTKTLAAKLAVDEAYLATPVVDGCDLIKP